jgi:hypothetical protein
MGSKQLEELGAKRRIVGDDPIDIRALLVSRLIEHGVECCIEPLEKIVCEGVHDAGV